jgi:DNA polymerase III alpha subunit
MYEKFKREIAYKLRIGDILSGKSIIDGERFSFLELGNKKIVRVNIIANIVEKYDSEDKRYSFLTIDDGSGQIRIKIFGENVEKFKNKNQGQTILVIGTLRNFNNELYINPEIIKEKDVKYLLVRKMEIDKEREKNFEKLPKEKKVAAKDKILEVIKNSEENGGIDTEEIIMNLRDISPERINQEIQKFIEEGIVFEPRPGKVRWLG